MDAKPAGMSSHGVDEDVLVYDNMTAGARVKAGTVPALVGNLTRHDVFDGDFSRIFLTTYKSFTTAQNLFSCLVDRFEDKQEEERIGHMKAAIQLRVINVLKQWLVSFWMEPSDDESTHLLLRMKLFVGQRIVMVDKKMADQLVICIDSHLSGNAHTHLITSQKPLINPPKPLLPRKLKKLELLKINAVEMARQLTTMESHMFGKVRISELANQTWQKKAQPGESERAPNVRALIRYSNQLSNWVGSLILEHSDLKKRALVIGHLIQVADVRVYIF